MVLEALGIDDDRMSVVVPDPLRADWDCLVARTPAPAPFDPAMAEHLPAPARRWLDHAIAPGTALCRRTRLTQRGRLRLNGRWRPMQAVQALDPLAGFVWVVEVRLLGLPVRGFDRLVDGTEGWEGEMRHRLFGRFTVVHVEGPDYRRSAAARAAAELMWAPAAALDPGVEWRSVDDARCTAVVPVAGHEHEVTLTVADDGALRAITLPRWTQAEGGDDDSWGLRPFAGRIERETTFGGFTVPSLTVAGYGDDWRQLLGANGDHEHHHLRI